MTNTFNNNNNRKQQFFFNFEEDNLPAFPYTSFDSFDTNSPPLSGSTYHDTDSLSDKSKLIRKKRNTYQKIDDESRIKLLDLVQQGETLKAAARRYGINYSSAKSILHTFRKEGRILKKSAQERNARKRVNRTASDLEMSPIYPYKQCQQDFNIDGSEDASQPTCYSSDLKMKSEPSSLSALTDEESPKVNTTGITINSFGDFLRIDSQGSQKSSDSMTSVSSMNSLSSKAPSTIVFKLEPQHLQRNPSMEVKGGNWQLNVNVHSKPVETQNVLRVPDELRSFDVFCSNYASSPLYKAHREELDYEPEFFNKRYNTITDIITNSEDIQTPEEPNYDISCFLNSSPAYAFQPKTNEMDQFVTLDNFEAQENYYDGQNRNAYVKSASLCTY